LMAQTPLSDHHSSLLVLVVPLDDQFELELISFTLFTAQINTSFLPSQSLAKNVEILRCVSPLLAHVWVLSYKPDVHVDGVREHAAISPRDVRDVLVFWNERPLRCIPGVRWGRAASWPRQLGLKAERKPLEEALQKEVDLKTYLCQLPIHPKTLVVSLYPTL